MAFIEKKDPVVINIKLTSKGRELLSKGNLKFKYFAIGDSEVDYNFNAETGHNESESLILRPLDNNPNILSFISRDVSGDPYNEIPSVGSEYLVTNTAESVGFFTNSGTTFITDSNHVKQPDAMVDVSTVAGGTQLALLKAPTYGTSAAEPAVGDVVLVKWTIFGDTTSHTINKTQPTPFLMYEIQSIVSGSLAGNNLVVEVDRNLPDFSSYSPTGLAGALIYKSKISFSGETLFDYSPDYLDESVISFLQNSQCPTVIFPFWNMSIIFTEEIAGVQAGNLTYGDFDSHTYAGFLSYIQNQAPIYKKLGVIHYTNSSPANVYAEGFYLNTPKLIIPTIMWHKSSGNTLGATFIAGNGFILEGLNAHYYELVDATNPTVVVGKIFDELKLFVIEDPELLFAMSYKSNRSWTLPMPFAAAGGGCAEPEPIYSLETIVGTPGSIQNTGGKNITEYGSVTEYGMQFKKLSDTIWSSTIRGYTLTQNTFTTSIGNIDANTDYQYRAYVVYNGVNLITGDILTIKTLPAPPVYYVPAVNLLNLINITQTTADAEASVVADGGQPVTARGIVWNSTQNPSLTSYMGMTTNGTGMGAFTGNITGLAAGSPYYVRAYATNSVGTAYSAQLQLNTLAPAIVAPTVTTANVTAIVSTGAKSGGNVTADGGASVTAKGVVWSINSNPLVTLPTKTNDGTGLGGFLSLIGGLTPSTKYYIRAYATNSAGTGYGSQFEFTTTAAATIPTLTTMLDTIQTTTANVDGSITSDGGSAITQHGMTWSLTSGPDITSPTKTTQGAITAPVVFSSVLSPLAAGTTYYVRAYATNGVGTGYGNQETFTTLSPAIPVFINLTLDTCRGLLETTPPIMPSPSCFNLTVDYMVHKGPAKGTAFACVVCNGTPKYTNSSVGTPELSSYDESGTWGPFIVKDTDIVCFCATGIDVYEEANTFASISLASISNVVGTFNISGNATVWGGTPIP